MNAPYDGDCCPACGSYQVTPYAVILGAREEYGYHCQACEVTWRVLTYDGTVPAESTKSPAA